VLAALREELAERPLKEVPVAAVITRAGVSRKTFYEHWASKEECFVSLYERELARLVEPTLQAFAGHEPWVDRLRTAIGVLLGGLAADPLAARICFVEVLAAGPTALARRNEATASLDPLFDYDNVTTAAGSPRPRAVTAGAIGYLSETLNREIAAGRAEQLPELRAELMYTLTLPFVGPRGATRELELDGSDAELHPDAATERGFLTAYGAAAADMLGRVAEAMGEAEVPAARVRAGVGALLDFCAERPDDARACIVEALSVGPAARARRGETTARLADLFAEPLRELRPSERIARVSALALVGGFHELVFDAVDRRATGELPSLDTVVAAARLDSDHVA
jgi:AcrR family transcriptional regulator